MKWVIVIFVMLTCFLIVNGQEKGPESNRDQKNTQSKTTTSSPTIGINVVNEQTATPEKNGPEKHSQSYLYRLFSSENLPNVGLFVVGLVGAIIAICTLLDIQRQTKATEGMLYLTHRPKLIIRNIVIHGMVKLNSQTPMDQQSPVLSGYYAVANIGGLPATPKRRKEGTWCNATGLPMERPDRENPGNICNDVIAPGESKEFTFRDMVLSTQDAIDLVFQKTTAYFLVQIEYTDGAGIQRQTSACRRFFTDTRRFSKVEDSDYEYAD